jgi:hypothetical protein
MITKNLNKLTANYQQLLEAADEVLDAHKGGNFYPDFDELEKTLEELTGQNFYKRWGLPTPAEERLKLAKGLKEVLADEPIQRRKNTN